LIREITLLVIPREFAKQESFGPDLH
jgi:hypothetical protein